ncbi:hypothetical protein [Caldibacillus debilis]|nr:hypothetical protein [Caldibacillus debilis]
MYYHIKKPETIGLIEAVKEGQAGNMKQKYYLAEANRRQPIHVNG